MLLPKQKRPNTLTGISEDELTKFETRLSETLKQIDSLASLAEKKPSLEQRLYITGKLDLVQEKVREAAYQVLTCTPFR
jgi:hypothetical protein